MSKMLPPWSLEMGSSRLLISYLLCLGEGLSFVHAAFKELLECRSVLQHSYAYSFFKFESLALKRHRRGTRLHNEKAAFEQMQSELEMITEQMSDIVARSHLRATQTQILFLTAGASERRREFSNVIFTLMSEEWKRQKAAENKAGSGKTSPIPLPARVDNNTEGIFNQAQPGGDVAEMASPIQNQQQQRNHETVRDALLASLEAFMANSDEAPLFTARVDNDAGENFYEEDDEDDGQFGRSWACSACTYMNTTGRHCAMCGTPAGS